MQHLVDKHANIEELVISSSPTDRLDAERTGCLLARLPQLHKLHMQGVQCHHILPVISSHAPALRSLSIQSSGLCRGPGQAWCSCALAHPQLQELSLDGSVAIHVRVSGQGLLCSISKCSMMCFTAAGAAIGISCIGLRCEYNIDFVFHQLLQLAILQQTVYSQTYCPTCTPYPAPSGAYIATTLVYCQTPF